MKAARMAAFGLMAMLAGCGHRGGDEGPAFSGIGPDEIVDLAGTEPFWSAHIAGGEAVYTTPENADGTRFSVTRFPGNNGVSFSGTVAGTPFDAMVTPGTCSDGMSDRTYPYTATVMIGADKREGCGWTDKQPFHGPAAP